jgi:Mrp family chromosome partitioning ATPase
LQNTLTCLPIAVLTDYIVGNYPLKEVLTKVKGFKNLDVITSGPVPPNPSEFLMHPKITSLFELAKEHYDYIIIDSSPVGLVADSFIISKFTDISFFILRHKYTYKSTIQFVEKLYSEHKLNR